MSGSPRAGSSLTARRPQVAHHRGNALRLPSAPGSPDKADLKGVREWVRSGSGLTAVDLFAGAGGLSLGLSDAGFRVVAAADGDPLAVETHEANLGGLGYCGDLTDPDEFLDFLRGWGIDEVDLVAGGPPCQPFSRAGQSRLRDLVQQGTRAKRDFRAGLWMSFVRVVDRLRPRAVLMENVPDLAGWDDGAVLVGFLESLHELGYEVEARILDAPRFGVPQHRSRLFLVGLRDGGAFRWPTPLAAVNTLRDAIGDLPAVGPAQRRECIGYWVTETSGFAERMRRDVPDSERGVIFDHITRDVRPDDAEAFALLPEGGTYRDLPARLQRYRTDIFSDKYKRLSWDAVSRAITAHLAKDGYWYIHPEQQRTLSVREAARVQTFPDWFRFAGEPTHRYRQIGNAVPPLLAEAIGTSIRRSLQTPRRRPRPRPSTEFRTRLLDWHAGNARTYPWRRGRAPWAVLMAEMCLRRTRADQVVPVFGELERIAPEPADLVERADDALRAMSSLGLQWRATNLVDVARALRDEHGGDVPSDEGDLRSLPGVGDYVTQAVLCFGFGRRAVLLDTNTSRIVGRLHGRPDARRRWQMRLDLYSLAGPEGPDADFNYALLDFGALVCQARSPKCEVCPVADLCATNLRRPSRLGAELTPDEVTQ